MGSSWQFVPAWSGMWTMLYFQLVLRILEKSFSYILSLTPHRTAGMPMLLFRSFLVNASLVPFWPLRIWRVWISQNFQSSNCFRVPSERNVNVFSGFVSGCTGLLEEASFYFCFKFLVIWSSYWNAMPTFLTMYDLDHIYLFIYYQCHSHFFLANAIQYPIKLFLYFIFSSPLLIPVLL